MNSHQSVPELRSLWSNYEFFNLGSDILLFKTTALLMEMDETKLASRNFSSNDMDEGKEALTHFVGS
ncbi:MAG: hypothetical protein WCF23_21465 [Candidatus Nitrosopolaris sp.]